MLIVREGLMFGLIFLTAVFIFPHVVACSTHKFVV